MMHVETSTRSSLPGDSTTSSTIAVEPSIHTDIEVYTDYAVRVTLNPKAWKKSGAKFEATSVKLDSSARIAEFLLNPIR